jgi:hypothetical protein
MQMTLRLELVVGVLPPVLGDDADILGQQVLLLVMQP